MAGTPSDDDARAQRALSQRLGQGPTPWQRAAVGVRVTSDALASLPASRWTVLAGVHWPGSWPGGADHVVVGRSGVYVVGTRNWSGPVRVRGGMLVHGDRIRGVRPVAEAAAQVASLLDPRTAACVHPVLCLARDEPLVGVVDGVFVCSAWNVRELLQSRPRALSRRRARAVARQLRAELRPGRVAALAVRDRPTRAGSGGDSLLGDLVRAGVLLTGFAVVIRRPELVTDPALWLGERLSQLGG